MSTGPLQQRSTDFRPRYPLDPFTSVPLFSSGNRSPNPTLRPSIDLHDPWLLKFEYLPASQALRRDVILVLGTPVDRSLDSFLISHWLSNSLVIIATHVPPPLFSSFIATVRVLRLNTPLVVEDNGAVRLVSILEWAERIARMWRTHGASGADYLEFNEVSMENPETPPRVARSSLGTSFQSSPNLGNGFWKSGSFGSKLRHFSLQRKRMDSSVPFETPSFSDSPSLPPIDPTQRPFDAIIHYVLECVAEKQTLKQTILVTSITRPFLASPVSPYSKISQFKDKRISKEKSMMRQHSLYSLPPTPPYHSGESLHPVSSRLTAISSISSSILAAPSPFAHVIHIIPRSARSNLIQSLDSFLASFSVSNVIGNVDHAKQYIMHGSTLCATVAHHPQEHEQEWTVAELILNGSFDDIRGKAWLGSGKAVLLPPPGGDTSGSEPSSALSSQPSIGKPLTDHTYPPPQLNPLEIIPLGEKSERWPGRTVADLTPPPSPLSRATSIPAKLNLPSQMPHIPSPTSERPKRYASQPRPHSEVMHNIGSAYHFHDLPQNPRTSALPRFSPNRHVQDWNGLHTPVPSNDLLLSAPASTQGSSIPTLTGVAMSGGRETTKILRKSKLNMIVHVNENDMEAESRCSEPLPTPPDSDDSGDRAAGQRGHIMNQGGKKYKWQFWRAR